MVPPLPQALKKLPCLLINTCTLIRGLSSQTSEKVHSFSQCLALVHALLERVMHSGALTFCALRTIVMPAPAGIQAIPHVLDPRLRGDDVP
jgi:hypothetical protein